MPILHSPRTEKICICTDNPEYPTEKAVMSIADSSGKSADFLTARVISKKDAPAALTVKPKNLSRTAQTPSPRTAKKITKEQIFTIVIPAVLMESVRILAADTGGFAGFNDPFGDVPFEMKRTDRAAKS